MPSTAVLEKKMKCQNIFGKAQSDALKEVQPQPMYARTI